MNLGGIFHVRGSSQWTGPCQPGWHTGTPKGRTTQHHPAPAELCPFIHCQPAWSRSANIAGDSCEAAIFPCNRGKRCSLLVKLPVLKAARDINASAAARASKSKLLCSPQLSASPGRAEAAVTKPASFECGQGYCKEQVGASQALTISRPWKMQYWKQLIDSHAAVLLKNKLCKNDTLWLPGLSCCLTS